MNEKFLERKIAQLEERLYKLENKPSPLEHLIWSINELWPQNTFSLDLANIVQRAQEFENE